MSKVHDLSHNGIKFVIYEYEQYCHWDIKDKSGGHIQRQESDLASAKRKAKKFIDKHKLLLA